MTYLDRRINPFAACVRQWQGGAMGVTTITTIDNRSSSQVTIANLENAATGVSVPAHGTATVGINVPWAATQPDFASHHLELRYGAVTRFWIWQANTDRDADHVRFSINGQWSSYGRPVHGVSNVDGPRTLVVYDNGFALLDMPADIIGGLAALSGSAGYRLTSQQPVAAIPSVPRYTASAFSVAGPPSDAYAARQADARFRYTDEGKRYRYELRNGVAVAIGPDGTTVTLTQAVSYQQRRAGTQLAAPAFDLIAANGGRIFAKQAGSDQFWVLTMDETFIHVDDLGAQIAVPSTYFKLDPEFDQPNINIADVTRAFDGAYGGHPATVRFPLFQLLLAQNRLDMMMVAMRPRVWHLVDLRPPVGVFNVEAIALLSLFQHSDLGTLLAGIPLVQRMLGIKPPAYGPDITPPAGTPTYPAVTYTGPTTVTLPQIHYDKVLDIGVGHAHWHEQWDGSTGGEMQPMRTGPFIASPPISYADLYAFANGPVYDGDGFVDGTCNFYALVRLANNAGYALLYADEQSYFTQRWRVVGPDDTLGLSLALVCDLPGNPHLYGWDRSKYWSPFTAGLIASNSRLAVSRQVILVSAPESGGTGAVLFSTNFSYSSMDRTWRWRKLPGQPEYFADDAARGAEQINPALDGRVWPETVRLREDMTIAVKGTVGRPGRWVQRYLPASQAMTPSAPTGSMPTAGYAHRWRFVGEDAYQAADRFSRFGVYAPVDTRSQYYTVTAANADSLLALARGASDPGPWIDSQHVICTRLMELQWAAPPGVLVDAVSSVLGWHIVGFPKSPPSLFNTETRLRIVRRGSQWLAQLWDKRDDDLISFDGMPLTVTLTKGSLVATVTLQSRVTVPAPPISADAASLAVTGGANRSVTVQLTSAARVWRVRIAAFDAVPNGNVVSLLDVEEPRFVASGTTMAYTWIPTAAQAALITRYATAAGAAQFATSLWVEDVAGNVCVPDTVVWSAQAPPVIAAGHPGIAVRNANGSWTPKLDLAGATGFTAPIAAIASATTADDVHYLFAGADGSLWHTMHHANGSWDRAGDVKGQIGDQGHITAVSAACSDAGTIRFVYATADGGLWHTARLADGSWQRATDVKLTAGDQGAVTAVAITSTGPSKLQMLFATRDGALWYSSCSILWTPAVDARTLIGNHGTVRAVAAASAGVGTAQFLVVTDDGNVWHTTLKGTAWDQAGAVKGQIGDPGAVTAVAAADGGGGDVQFLLATSDGRMWHTIRHQNGGWDHYGDVIGQIGDPGGMSTVSASAPLTGVTHFAFA